MNYETIVFTVENNLAVLTMNRPESLNAVNSQLIKEMRDAVKRVNDNPELRALVITGAGRGFCSGADLKGSSKRARDAPGNSSEMDAGVSVSETFKNYLIHYVNPLVTDIRELSKPVVAAVNGVAAGAGVGIALSADIVIAARSARFIQVFGPQLGLVPDMGCTWFLPRLIGQARALGLMLLGYRLPAETAEEWGLIWKCVDDKALMEEAMQIGRTLADGPTFAFGLTKKAVLSSDRNTLKEQLDVEAEYQGLCVATEDNREGVKAFLFKQTPQFKGR